MTERMDEAEVSGEGGEGKQEIVEEPSVEHVELEAVTTEPETVVERTVEYSEAEAIEAAFVDLVEPVSEASSEEGEHRVKTKIPLIQDASDPQDEEALDDSASSTEANSQRGSYTLPEVGDEAVIDNGELDPRDHYAGVAMQPGEVLQDQDWNEAESGGEVEVALGEADSELDVRADSATEGEHSTTRQDAEGHPGEMAEAIPINIPHPRPDKPTEAEDSISIEGAEGPPGEQAEAIPINIPYPRPDEPAEGQVATTGEGAEGPPGEMAEAIPINIPHPRPDSEAMVEADDVVSNSRDVDDRPTEEIMMAAKEVLTRAFLEEQFLEKIMQDPDSVLHQYGIAPDDVPDLREPDSLVVASFIGEVQQTVLAAIDNVDRQNLLNSRVPEESMGDLRALLLQNLLDREGKAFQILSHLMKNKHDAAKSIIQNLK